jgi:TolB protein
MHATKSLARRIVLVSALIATGCSGDDPPPGNGVQPPIGSPAPAPASALSTDQLVFNGQQTGNFEIYTVAVAGGDASALTDDTAFDSWWPRVSPDRTKILFYRTPAGTGDDYAQTALWVMDWDGSNQTELIPNGGFGWTIQGHAEWSPNGDQFVMCGTASQVVHIFTTDSQGNNPVQKTNDGTFNCDPAFSPDGQLIIFNRCTTAGPCTNPSTKPDLEIYTMPAAGGVIAQTSMTQLTTNNVADYDPYYSPDGLTIAWLRQVSTTTFGGIGSWSIFAMDNNGANERAVIDDGFLSSKPAWSLDGEKLYFHRIDATTDSKWALFQINPDGSDLTKIDPLLPVNLEYPSN